MTPDRRPKRHHVRDAIALLPAVSLFVLALVCAFGAAGVLKNLFVEHPDSQKYLYIVYGGLFLILSATFLSLGALAVRGILRGRSAG